MTKTEAKGTKKGFKLTKRWTVAIAVLLSLALLVTTGLIASAALKNSGIKVFDAYIKSAKSQNVKGMAGTLYEKGSDEYNDFVDKYENGKKQYETFIKGLSETDKAAYLAVTTTSGPDDLKDYGLKLAWERTFAKNIKKYSAHVTYSDAYSIRIKVKITYKESYSSTSLPARLGAKEIPSNMELEFKRVGKKWYFTSFFQLAQGQEGADTWTAPYSGGGTEVKRVNNFDIPTTGIYDLEAALGIDDIRSIGSRAFMGCSRLKTLIIPEGLVNIGSEAFKDCKELEEIIYSDGSYVTADKEIKVGEAAFYNCAKLESFQLSSVNKIIPNYVFFNCSALNGEIIERDNRLLKNEYMLADATVSIGYYAFYGCAQLTHIPLPASVTAIGDGAFENCSSLTGLEPYAEDTQSTNILSEKLIRIGSNAFKKSGLKAITLPENLVDISMGAFNGCENLAAAELPENVRSIGAYAFANTGLNGISFPAMLEKIGNYAFYNSKIGNMTWEKNSAGGTSIRTLGEHCFNSCESLVSFELPESIRGIGKGAFINCTLLRNVMINFPSSVVIPPINTENGEIFRMSAGIPKIYVKEEAEAFRLNWYNMSLDIYSQDIIKGDFAVSIETIGGKTENILVQYLGTETDVKIREDITRIGNGAFSYSKQLKSITNFADLNLNDVGRDVFAGCDQMNFESYSNSKEGNLKYLSGWLIDGTEAEGFLDLTNRSKYIRSFDGNTYPLPDTVGIAASAFDSANILNAKFNKELKYICDSAFPRLLELETVEFEAGSEIFRIGREAFYNSALGCIDLPESLVEIGERAFFGCDNLRYAIINSDVTLGGTVLTDTKGGSYVPENEWVFSAGYDVLKLYIKDYGSAFFQNDPRWQSYKKFSFDKSIIVYTDEEAYAITETERDILDKDGKVIQTVKEMTFIQLLSTNRISFVLPDAARRIGAGAFAKSTIQKIEIHSAVTRVEQYAFYECKELYSVTFRATGGNDSLLYIGTHAFRDTDELSGPSAEIIFEAAAPNSDLKFGTEPFDTAITRKVSVGVRANYIANDYWKANPYMLDAKDDPSLILEVVIFDKDGNKLIIPESEHGNRVSPFGTIKNIPGEEQGIVATVDTYNGYDFDGFYDENGKLITNGEGAGDNKYGVTAVFGEAWDEQTYIARFIRVQAWVRVVVDEYSTGGDIYLDGTKLATGESGGRLVDCGDTFTLKVDQTDYPEYDFDGWFVNGARVGDNTETEKMFSIEYSDRVIEARFVKARAWIIVAQQTGGTVTLENESSYSNVKKTASEIRVLLASGESATFKAERDDFYQIDSWYNGIIRLDNNEQTHEFVMTPEFIDNDLRVRATFVKINVPVSVTLAPEGSGIVYIDGKEYEGASVGIPHGAKVFLVADGTPGYKFKEWIVTVGGVVLPANSDELLELDINTTNEAHVISIEAVFEWVGEVEITVNYNGGYGTVELNGAPCAADSVNGILYNDSITLEATPDISGATKYWFAGWEIFKDEEWVFYSAQNTIVIKVDGDAEYRANFRAIEAAELKVLFNSAWGNVEYYFGDTRLPAQNNTPIAIDTGTVIELTAVYNKSLYVFQGWYDADNNCLSENETYNHVVSETNEVIEARFQKTVKLDVQFDAEMGSYTLDGDLVTGSSVTLKATPATGYKFVGWYVDGELVSDQASYTLLLSASVNYDDLTYEAVFEDDV